MSRNIVRQKVQIRNSVTYDDTVVPSEANFETNAATIQDDLNNLRSQASNLLSKQTGNWYDDLTAPTTLETGTKRGVDDLNEDLHVIEKKRVLKNVLQESINIRVGASDNYVVLTAAQLPSQTTAAIGAVTTLGTVCAYASSLSAASLEEVAGKSAINPANRVQVVDANTGFHLLSSGRKIYGLFQSESNTDGSTLSGTASNRAKISFVRPNSTFDDFEVCPAVDIQGKLIKYLSRERVRFEDLADSDLLPEDTIVAQNADGTIYSNVELIGTKNGTNVTFTTPLKFYRENFLERLMFNGVRQDYGVEDDYIVYESGGIGTGYDTIVMNIAPISGEHLTIDYQVNDGGYVEMLPENIPMLEYNAAGIINVLSKPGRSSSLLLTLSNEVQYAAVSPLTMNMATSGLGGLESSASEASSTWYYIYAVPSATDGQFDVIASPNDPETGPDDYSIFKYLGAVLNDSSSNFRTFNQAGTRFMFDARYSYGGLTADASYHDLDVNNYVPKTGIVAHLMLYNNAAACSLSVRPDGATGSAHLFTGTGIYFGLEGSIPTPDADKSLQYSVTSGGSCILYALGWEDGYLD